MRHYLWGYLIAFMILSLTYGCSSGKGTSPMSPSGDNAPAIEKSNGHSVLLSGTFAIDPVTGEIRDVPERNPEFHYNITGFIGGNFKYFLTSWAPPNVTVRLELTNPTALQVWDVRIIYLDLFGKTVMNPDGYTNYLRKPSGAAYNPFTYFAKEFANHAFPVGPGVKDTEILQLYYPGGAQPNVTYAIECCLGANAEEPYKIDSIATTGSITPQGGAAMVSCSIYDWQSDITSVKILAGDFYPEDLPMYKFRDTNSYIGNLMNMNTVAAGNHMVWIKAESNSPLGIALWMPFVVNVPDTASYAPKFVIAPLSTRNPLSKGAFTYLSGAAEDLAGGGVDYMWEQLSPVSPTGAFSGSGGRFVPYARWDPPQVSVDTEYIFRINATDQDNGKVSRAVCMLLNQKPLPPEITFGPVIFPSPVDENHEAQFGATAIDPNFPTEIAPFKYLWEQVSPVSPQGSWVGTSNGAGQYPVWIAPSVSTNTQFTFKVTVTKDWVSPALSTNDNLQFMVNNTD